MMIMRIKDMNEIAIESRMWSQNNLIASYMFQKILIHS